MIHRVLEEHRPIPETCDTPHIKVKKTRPRRPQTNGKAERFIQTLLREWTYVRALQYIR